MKNKLLNKTLKQVYPYILLIGGIIGTLSAAILTYEKIELLKHPTKQLACDLNPILACGSVINTHQAAAFGFPNPFLGLIGFSIVATTGAAMLAGAKFKRWYWLGMQAGVTFAIAFVFWLQYQSIYEIGALCPFCMVVWAVTIPIFFYTTLYNLREKHIKTPAKLKSTVEFIQKHQGDIIILWYVITIALIAKRFWYYWSTLI